MENARSYDLFGTGSFLDLALIFGFSNIADGDSFQEQTSYSHSPPLTSSAIQTALSSPGEDRTTLFSPWEDRTTLSSPGEDRTTISSPWEDRLTLSSSGNNRITLSRPGEDRTTLYSPGDGRSTFSSPGEDRATLSSPGEDRDLCWGWRSMEAEISPSSIVGTAKSPIRNQHIRQPCRSRGAHLQLESYPDSLFSSPCFSSLNSNSVRLDCSPSSPPAFDPYFPVESYHITPVATPKNTVCVFCKKNGEALSVYGAHVLKDSCGRVACPVLRRYTCPICGASGDSAHTVKYCPRRSLS